MCKINERGLEVFDGGGGGYALSTTQLLPLFFPSCPPGYGVPLGRCPLSQDSILYRAILSPIDPTKDAADQLVLYQVLLVGAMVGCKTILISLGTCNCHMYVYFIVVVVAKAFFSISRAYRLADPEVGKAGAVHYGMLLTVWVQTGSGQVH